MILNNCRKSNSFKQIISIILSFVILVSIFSLFNSGRISASESPITAIKVTNVANPISPFMVQNMWLEPNTQYSFSYLYNNKPADSSVTMKGSNQKYFNQSAKAFDEDVKKVTVSFTTTDKNDSEATIGTGVNAGKILGIIGIRLYSSNTTAVGNYYANFELYKTSDAKKINLFKDLDFSNMGSIETNSTWNAFWKTDVRYSFVKESLQDDSIFKIQKEPSGITALKVTNVTNPQSPFLVQNLWLEPNTNYSFSYLYSNKPADSSVTMKGTNQKYFEQSEKIFDEDLKRVTVNFTTTDKNDSEATIGTGVNSGKILTIVGIRLYSSNTTAVGNYYTDFVVSKANDTENLNLLKDSDFSNMGSVETNAAWNGFWKTDVRYSFKKEKLQDDSIFKVQKEPSGVVALKVTNVSNPVSPFMVQNVWLEPNTQYTFSYLYSKNPADSSVTMKGTNQKTFVQSAKVFDEDIKKVTVTFTTTDQNDSEATIGTGNNVGKILAIIGIRLYSTNFAAIGNYFTNFILFKSNDIDKTNVLKDPKFTNMGSSDTNAIWNGFWNINVLYSYVKETLEDDSIFKIQKDPSGFTALKVTNVAKPESPFMVQKLWLDPNTQYSFSYLYSKKPADCDVTIKGTNQKSYDKTERVFDKDKKKVTITFKTTDKDDPDSTIGTGDNEGKILAIVGIRLYSYNTSVIGSYYGGFDLYKTDDEEKNNLFSDQLFSNMGSIESNAKWNGIFKLDVKWSFVKDILKDDSIFKRTYGVLVADNGFGKQYVGQWRDLECDKTYVASFYYTPLINPEHFCLLKDEEGNSFNILSIKKDDKYLKATIEFTLKKDSITNLYDNAKGYTGSGVLAYVGFCFDKTDEGYIYDWQLYQKNDTDKNNLIDDPTFTKIDKKLDGGCWYGLKNEKPTDRFQVISLDLIGGKDTFLIPDISGNGTDYVIKSSGEKNPFFMQRVSLDPKKTYAFSFYHSNKISQGVYTGKAKIYTGNIDKNSLDDTYIQDVINDKEWNKTTTIFTLPDINSENVVKDPDKPGNILVYVGIRVWEEKLYYYDFELYDINDSQKQNLFVDCDYKYIGYKWFQYFWTEAKRFSRIKLSSLDGGLNFFKKKRGPDINVPLGDKMISYCSIEKQGTLYIDLPYSIKSGQTTGKYYLVSVCIRPVEGREPSGFVTSTYNGGITDVSPISINGYKYTFYLQERYGFRLGIKFTRGSNGFLSCLEMYTADQNQNKIGNQNLSTAFGKNGTFADWNIQPGLRWLDLSDGCLGTYPGELPSDYTGKTSGKLVEIPKNYFILEDPGIWWNKKDVGDSNNNGYGTISGIVKNSNGKVLKGIKVLLCNVNDTKQKMISYSNTYGKFIFSKVPLDSYNLYIVESDGNKVPYDDLIWIEENGSIVDVNLTYNAKNINNISETITSSIKGCIVDKNGKPINNLFLRLDPDNISVVTDGDGNFEFINVSAGLHSIMIISDKGYTFKLSDIIVEEGVTYTLKSSDGSPLVYDERTKTISKNIVKVEKNNSTIIIFSIIAFIVLAGGTVGFVFLKKSKQNKVH